MNGLERAEAYAAIFLNAGDGWRGYVPLDATVTGDRVHVQGVQMERTAPQEWRLTENGKSWIVRPSVPPTAEEERQHPNPECRRLGARAAELADDRAARALVIAEQQQAHRACVVARMGAR